MSGHTSYLFEFREAEFSIPKKSCCLKLFVRQEPHDGAFRNSVSRPQDYQTHRLKNRYNYALDART